jgi:hypothetical protein
MTVPMPHLRSAVLAGCLLALAGPAAADAAFFPAEAIDGPSATPLTVSDLDVARDGTGAVAYVKSDNGADHVFVSLLVNGTFTTPERVDPALATPSSQPVVGAPDGGRVTVAFVSGGSLYTTVHPSGGSFSAAQGIANGAANPSVDMSINGVAYASFTAPGGSASDVHVARLAGGTTQFTLLDGSVDVDPTHEAGDGVRRSHVAISADGTAVITWGEADHVYARRVFGTRLSAAPQDLNVPEVGGLTGGGSADSATVDIEDDSSYAWVLFRERFAGDGRVHVVARRLVGSAFEAPALVDGLGVPGGADAGELALELNGRGEGISATGAGTAGVFGAILHNDTFFGGAPLGAGGPASLPAVGIGENNDAFAAWLPGDGTTHMRPYDIDPAKADPPPPGPESVVSNPTFGAVERAGGMDMGVNRAGDAVAVFVERAPDGQRLVFGTYDRPPGTFRTYTTSKYRKFVRPPLSWQGSFDLWGPLNYSVEVDGQPIGQTTDTKLTPVNPVPDGVHSWRVVATDRRGQVARTPTRPLRVDSLPPEVTLSVSGVKKAGRQVKVNVRAADGSLLKPSGSGVKLVRIDFGDGAFTLAPKATHRYRRGKVTVRASVTDAAGNGTVVTKRITIKK